ncbi:MULTISPECIES: MFS transporter [unclassified Amycolatopsis]|uniref:MFS transporter n=1 Tax=unclassified Amycolatopsis TaxID=2618356 RepID=UPI0028768362|nr:MULTISPECIES: MFS transporter [unclassified Amycolatopsis]MDS0140348.1 MFS transporter [Amycolatopsis sp. 505]MDS0149048.1 MFS transporter [Amycolatopsis sp. CM201R]
MIVLPLALAQFVASYAATTMTVAVSAIAADLGTTVIGVQTAITVFTLTMASLMVPGSKLSDLLGRKRCFLAGLGIYGAGALLASAAPGPGLLIAGYSLLEGIGSALIIPPIYILVTVTSRDLPARARAFGVVSGAGALGAAAGPLVGGLVTTWLGWRASFLLQVLLVGLIVVLALRIAEPPSPARERRFDVTGAVLSAAGLFFVVFGVLQAGTYGWLVSRADFAIGGVVLLPAGGLSPVWLFAGVGAVFLAGFFAHVRARERKGREPLVPSGLFRDRGTGLGLLTQHVQWLVLQGSFFVVAVFLQQVRGYDAIETGLMLTPATIGILAASAAAGRMARRHPQRGLVRAGFVVTVAGLLLVLLLLVRAESGVASAVPGLFLLGAGVGIMLTASVNLVQSRFPDAAQSDISGVSRSVSNLGSSVGTALAGSVLAGTPHLGGRSFALALTTLGVAAVAGLVAALLLPSPSPE